MNKFPGKIEKEKNGRTWWLVLNDEQKEWLCKWFPITENCRLAKAMGIGLYKLHCFAREMGLEKSEKGLKAIKRRQVAKALKTNIKNGCYDRKRGHPCSEATMAGCRRRWAEEHAGLRENVQRRIKREDPEKYKAWMEKRSQERKETIRKEKMRVVYGLPRQTNLKVVVMCPFKRSQLYHRRSALERGYILTEDHSEGSPDRYTIFYDDDTKRSKKFEENCLRDGFKFQKWV